MPSDNEVDIDYHNLGENETSSQAIEISSERHYSIFRDSQFTTYLTNTASTVAVLDVVKTQLQTNIDAVDDFIKSHTPYYVLGVYYILPALIPSIRYLKNHHTNQREIYDPAAIELLNIILTYDIAMKNLIEDNPSERDEILKIFTSYLKYSKNQSFTILTNFIYLAFRVIHGIFFFLTAAGFDADTNNKYSEWTERAASIISALYVSVILLHNNFQKFSYDDEKYALRKKAFRDQKFQDARNRLFHNASRDVLRLAESKTEEDQTVSMRLSKSCS